MSAATGSLDGARERLRRLLDAEPGLLGPTRLLYDAEAMFSLRDITRARGMWRGGSRERARHRRGRPTSKAGRPTAFVLPPQPVQR